MHWLIWKGSFWENDCTFSSLIEVCGTIHRYHGLKTAKFAFLTTDFLEMLMIFDAYSRIDFAKLCGKWKYLYDLVFIESVDF